MSFTNSKKRVKPNFSTKHWDNTYHSCQGRLSGNPRALSGAEKDSIAEELIKQRQASILKKKRLLSLRG